MNAPNDVRAMLVDAATRLFASRVEPKLLESAKREGWSEPLWRELERAELPLVSVPEAAGGAGGALSDAAAVLRVAGRHCAPVPLAETGMLAGWALAASGFKVPPGPLTAADGAALSVREDRSGFRVSGALSRVPWARIAEHVVVLAPGPAGDSVLSIDRARCGIRPGRNLAFEPRDEVELHDVTVPPEHAKPAGTGVTREALRLRGALARALLMAGALERALELSVSYAQTRTQFGRKIGQFQAIQQQLARFAGEVSAAVAASLTAAGVLERDAAGAFPAVAAAKIRTAEAAREGALIAHQIHGAIGVTDEYALHYATLRLWAWREEYGNEAQWSIELGRMIAAQGADQLWQQLTRNQEGK